MNRLFACLIGVVLIFGAVTFAPVSAQQTTSTPYVVEKGDNLWILAGEKLKNPVLWEKIYQKNPFLREPGRRFKRGNIVYVLIKPGEKLDGLEELGIIASFDNLDNLKLTNPGETVIIHDSATWPYWLVLVALVIAILAYLIGRMLNQNPATAREPMVDGGVSREMADRHFQEMAGSQFQRETGRQCPANMFTILEQTVGRIWGILNVRYGDGKEVPRRLNGERAFRARVRFPDQHEETLYMLQACGNDLRYGGISRYLPGPEFRFEADQPQVETPAPAPAPAPTPQPEPAQTAPAPTPTPAPEPTPAPTPQPESAQATAPTPQGEGVVIFEFKRSSNGQPAMVRLRGIEAEEFTFSVGPDGTTLRFREVDGEPVAH